MDAEEGGSSKEEVGSITNEQGVVSPTRLTFSFCKTLGKPHRTLSGDSMGPMGYRAIELGIHCKSHSKPKKGSKLGCEVMRFIL